MLTTPLMCSLLLSISSIFIQFLSSFPGFNGLKGSQRQGEGTFFISVP